MSVTASKIWHTVPPEDVLAYVAAESAKSGFILKVTLFGSRARGEARPFSDYDLAFELAPGTPDISWLASRKIWTTKPRRSANSRSFK